MPVDGTVTINVQAVTAQFERAMLRSGTIATAFGKLAADAMKRAGSEILELTAEVVDLRDQLADASTKTGLATKTLLGLRTAAAASGQSFETIESTLARFPLRLAEFQSGSKEAQGAFAKLGVTAKDTDGRLKGADEIFRELVSKLQGIEDPAERAAATMDLFGVSADELNIVLSSGSLDAFTRQAERFGADVGPEATAAADEWERSTAELQLVIDGLKASLVDTVGTIDLLDDFTVGLIATTAGLAAGFSELIDRVSLLAIAGPAMGAKIAEALGVATDEQRQTIAVAEELSKRIQETSIGGAAREAARDFIELRKETRQTVESVSALGEAGNDVARLGAGTEQTTEKVKDLSAANTLLNRGWHDLVAATLNDEQQRRLAIQDELALIRQAGEDTGRQEEAKQLAIEKTWQLEQQLADEKLAALEQRLVDEEEMRRETAEAIAANEAEIGAEISAREEEAAARRRQLQQDGLEAAAASFTQLSGLATDLLQDQIDFEASIGEAGKERAKKLFAAQKALSLASAIIQTAASVTLALANPPGPPLSTPQAIAAGVFGAVQIAKIAATQPSFHVGTRAADLAPDETMARVSRREVVLTPLGAAAANAGRAMETQGSMVLQVDHNYFEAMLTRAQRPGGPLPTKGTKRRVGHSGRGGT